MQWSKFINFYEGTCGLLKGPDYSPPVYMNYNVCRYIRFILHVEGACPEVEHEMGWNSFPVVLEQHLNYCLIMHVLVTVSCK
jgi:hypothetical protein